MWCRGLVCEPHCRGEETGQVAPGFGFNGPDPFAGWEEVVARMGRVSNDPACSLAGPGVKRVRVGRQVAADGLLG